MASHDLTLKNYQKQLKDNVARIYENYMTILKTQTEHVSFEVQVKSADIVRSYQALMQLVSEIRTFLIINDLVGVNQPNPSGPGGPQSHIAGGQPSMAGPGGGGLGSSAGQTNTDDKLVRLRDEMSMFLYELEIPLP